MAKKKCKFYAVRKGRTPGVYDNWEETWKQVNGHPNEYKGFMTEEEAWAYFKRTPVEGNSDDQESNDVISVFCAGSTLENGSNDARAGYAYVFPGNNAQPVLGPIDSKTSNRTVYLAALIALEQACMKDPDCQKLVRIFTNNKVLVDSMNEFIKKWICNGWKTAKKGHVENQDVIKELLLLSDNRRVVWEHVDDDEPKSEWHSEWMQVAKDAAENASHNAEPSADDMDVLSRGIGKLQVG